MKIQVRYFASVREQLGSGELVSLDEAGPGATSASPRTVAELRSWLSQRSPAHAAVLEGNKALRMAFNQTLCKGDQVLADGAEVAFFPPVTGG